MIVDSTPPKSQPPIHNALDNPEPSYNYQSLSLNPAAPERRKRSGKVCLWFTGIPVVLYVGFIVYTLYQAIFGLPHPHKHLYYDEKGKDSGESRDWSQVVSPMITKDSKFDIVASVWIANDSTRGKQDAVLKIDGEERPEKLIFTERIFRNLGVDGKLRSAEVKLRVPTSHFQRTNLSNYDLRASFVLVHSEGHRPSWLDSAQDFVTWKPRTVESPSVRKHDTSPTLEDKIYDSFGITIPLIEFHTQLDTDSDRNEGEGTENSLIAELLPTTEMVDSRRNSFKLEFTGKKRATEYHPYVVTRTHLRILEQDRLFQLSPYIISQQQVAMKTCVNSSGEPVQDPNWYECHRCLQDSGVFEATVGLQNLYDSDPLALYAPHLFAMLRAAGPMDLVPIYVDRLTGTPIESLHTLSSDEDDITVTWRLTFSSRAAESLLRLENIHPFSQKPVYNMTETKPTLQAAQYLHDYLVGIYDKVDENTHPRRDVVLSFISIFIRRFCWVLTIGYWYTRTTTTGISRLGTALVCLASSLGDGASLAGFIVSGNHQSWFSVFWALQFVPRFIKPLVMLAAISRVEVSWSTRKDRERDGRKKNSWKPRIHIAKATHSERTSERVEARLSRLAKLLLFVTAFAIAHYFITPNSYLLSPKVQPPPEKHPLESYSPHISTIMNFIETLIMSSLLAGHVLQFIMNFSSQTYVGDYKITSWLRFICRVLDFLHMLPHFAGSSLRMRGVLVSEGVLFVLGAVNLIQAVKYEYAKGLDGDEVD